MTCTIVYFSLGGKTRMAVETLAASLKADTLELKVQHTYPKIYFLQLFVGGAQAGLKKTPPLKSYKLKEGEDLYILATPIWNSTMTPAMRTFLKENSLKGKKVAALATSLSGGAEKCFEEIEQLIGEPLVATLSLRSSKKGFSAKEMERLERFSDQLRIDGQEE